MTRKEEKKKREERFNKILFNKDTSGAIPILDLDNDMVYPVDYDTLEDREMYRRAIMKSNDEK